LISLLVSRNPDTTVTERG